MPNREPIGRELHGTLRDVNKIFATPIKNAMACGTRGSLIGERRNHACSDLTDTAQLNHTAATFDIGCQQARHPLFKIPVSDSSFSLRIKGLR